MDSFEFVPTLEHEANISFGSEAPATSLWETPLSILEEKMMAFADAVAKLSDSSDAEIISRLHQKAKGVGIVSANPGASYLI